MFFLAAILPWYSAVFLAVRWSALLLKVLGKLRRFAAVKPPCNAPAPITAFVCFRVPGFLMAPIDKNNSDLPVLLSAPADAASAKKP